MGNTQNRIPDIYFWYFYYGKSDIFRRKLPKDIDKISRLVNGLFKMKDIG